MRLTQRLLTTLAVTTCALSLLAADASALGLKKGVKGGLNLATFRGDDADSEFNKFRTGFAAGLALEFALPVVAVEVDVLYAQRGAKLEGTQSAGGVTVSFEGETINNYIDVPVVAKLSVLPTPVLDVNVQLGASFAYLLSSRNDEAAAAIARVALESGALGEDWRFGADGSESACASLDEALDKVAQSRALDQAHDYGLETFLQREGALGGTHCIVFASALDYPWLAALKETISRFGVQFSLVLASDGLATRAEPHLWQRLLLRDMDGIAGTAASNPAISAESSPNRQIRDLLTDVGQLVESTLIIDRRTGAGFDQHLRRI